MIASVISRESESHIQYMKVDWFCRYAMDGYIDQAIQQKNIGTELLTGYAILLASPIYFFFIFAIEGKIYKSMSMVSRGEF